MLDQSRNHDIPVLFSLLKSGISLDILKLILNKQSNGDHTQLRYKGETLLFFSVDNNLSNDMLDYLLNFNNCQFEIFTIRNSLNLNIFDYLKLLNNTEYALLFNNILIDYIVKSKRLRQQLSFNGFDFESFIKNNNNNDEDLQEFLTKVNEYQEFIQKFHTAVELNDYENTCKYFKFSSNVFINNLIDSKVSINNQSAIHRAVLNQNIKITEFLLENRDSTLKLDSIRDHCYRTPLHYAYGMPNNKPIISLLLDYGFSENVFDKDGISPLDFQERQDSSELHELILLHKNKKLDVIEPNPWTFQVWTRLQQEKDSNKQISLFNNKILNRNCHSHGHSHEAMNNQILNCHDFNNNDSCCLI